jgi:hypothetical protein
MAKIPCGIEFCCNPATWHIVDGVGYCGQHHNWSHSYGGVLTYYKPEDCYDCQKEGRFDKENAS